MILPSCNSSKKRFLTLLTATLVVLSVGIDSALAIGQSGEQKDVKRVGHTDLQGRRAYHPDFIDYPDGRTIAFVGTHSGDHPNPLNGDEMERNGTMIIDITNPKKPVEKFHIPGVAGAQTQSNRMCLGSQLGGGLPPDSVYLMRNVQSNNVADTGYQVWDVTDVTNPTLVYWLHGITRAHKPWWECNTGIAYLPGSRIVDDWRTTQSMVIVDWSDLGDPKYLRTHGLPGGQPSGTGPEPPNLHGAISAHEHPNAGGMLARSATAMDVIGNVST
jgi:hypothetical protein